MERQQKKSTTTANGLGSGDFHHMSEWLYQKSMGEFFLYGCGGAASSYREACPGGWTGGSTIRPLSVDETKAWVEEHSDVDTYIELFGEVAE